MSNWSDLASGHREGTGNSHTTSHECLGLLCLGTGPQVVRDYDPIRKKTHQMSPTSAQLSRSLCWEVGPSRARPPWLEKAKNQRTARTCRSGFWRERTCAEGRPQMSAWGFPGSMQLRAVLPICRTRLHCRYSPEVSQTR